MNDLLKSAIADAKAIKDTAMQNAKATLEESIFYKVSPLLESNHENGEDEDKEDMKEKFDFSKFNKKKSSDSDSKDRRMESEETDDEEKDDTNEAYGEDDEEENEKNESASLEEILAELEEELKSSNIGSGDNKMDNYDSDTEDPQGPKYFTRKEVMGALESMFSEAIGDKDKEEEGDEEEEKKDMKQMQNELKEAYEVVNQLKGMLQEVNLLNSKLLYTSKLFRNYALSENQKKDILENFERVVTIREAKLLYSTYAKVHEGVDANKGKKSKSLTESFASKPTNSTAPSAATKSNIVNESNNLRARLQELAGIIK
jgi:hypothetical protein